MRKRFSLTVLAIALVAISLVSSAAMAQYGASTGNLYGKVVDEQGGVLPGVTVTLTGQGAPSIATSDARGEFRFLNLSPGTYVLKLDLTGFAVVTRENVVVSLGRNTEIRESLKLSSVAAAVTVTSETPVIDTRKVETGAVMTNEELRSIPTGRDPWVLLQSVPGVMVDRVNVAGSESGQQSAFQSKGTTAGTFTVDGVNFTDMNALGASNGYYDFETFQEVQIVTGGSDPSMQGAGAHINMITKRGTNEVHGSARINYVSDHFQGTNYPPSAGRRKIDSVQEYGIEVGGPIFKDTLWLWGSYGRNQINILVGAGAPPTKSNTTLENFNGKLNWQVVPSNSFNAWYQHSDKIVFGRGAGATRPQAATTDQTLPLNNWKAEDSQVVSSNLFFSAVYSGANGFFGLTPEGNGQLFYDANSGYLGTAPYYLAQTQPQYQWKADGSYFFNTGSMGHELKAGFTYLNVNTNYVSGSPANPAPSSNPNQAVKVGAFINTYGCDPDTGADCVPAAGIFRDGSIAPTAQYFGAFLGDTMTMDRLTIQVGVRWDQQFGSNAATVVAGNPSYPDVLPAIVYPGAPKAFTWNDWSPRVGLTYALGQNRGTVLKASYARFVDALGTATIGYTNPLGSSAGAYYPWNDTNSNNIVDVGEVNTTGQPLANFGYVLGDPSSVSSPNAIDPDVKAGHTDEFIGGIDYEVTPGFAVGAAYTYRKYQDPLVGLPFDPITGTVITRDDYVQYDTLTGTLPDGTPYGPENVFGVNPALIASLGGYPGGKFYTNRKDYDQVYSGFDFTMTKRLSNRWMARAAFSYGINDQNFSSPNGCPGDPNNGPIYGAPYGFFESSVQTTCREGDYISTQSQGSGSHYAVFLNAKYVYNINAMYQLPMNFNIAASFFGRQGYPVNYFVNTQAPGVDEITGATLGDGQTRAVAVLPVNQVRYPTLNELDLRLEKVIPFAATASVTIALDCFNAINTATILQRNNNLSSTTVDTVREVQNPWVLRWSARVSW